MKFNGLTNEGMKYLAKIQANQNAVTFSKIVIGDGRLDEHDNPAELTSLINKKTEKGIITKEQNGDTVTLLTYIDNISLSQGYYPREIGIYVNDNGMEKLYYYMNDGDETSWIPPESYGPFKIELKLNIIASNANSIIVNNYAKSMYVTKEYVDALNSAKLDKGGYTGTAKSLDDRITSVNSTLNSAKADKTINITAGSGLTGGGDLSTNRTITVGATDDSVVVGTTGIKVNTYDGGDSDSITRPVSSAFAKQLNVKGLYPRSTLSGTVNLDNITQQGLYNCDNLNKASFVNYSGDYYTHGMFEVLVDNVGSIIQRYTPHSTATPVLFRIKYYNSSWNSWRALVDNSNSWRIQAKEIPTNSDLNNYTENGFYYSRRGNNVIINEPYKGCGAFELTVTGIASDYTTQLLKDYRNNNYYVRTYNGDGASKKWTNWEKVMLNTELDRINTTLTNNKLDKGGYIGNAKTLDDRITSVNAQTVTNIRLGAKVTRGIWASTQSTTEDVGYITVSVTNHNADDVPDREVRRPLQFLKNGIWYTVTVV